LDHRIAAFTTSTLIEQQLGRIFAEHNLDYPVYYTTFDNLIQQAEKAVSLGTAVFIARGKSAGILMGHFDLPVVTLRFTYYDFYTALKKARSYGGEVVIIGFSDSWYVPLEQYRDELDNPRTIYLDTHEQLEETLQNLVKAGTRVIIGGQTAVTAARRHGLMSVRIGLEESSIVDSIEQAQHILRITSQRTEKIDLINSILNATSEGVVAVDALGVITSLNEAARQIFGRDCAGESLYSLTSGWQLRDAVDTGDMLRQELVHAGDIQCAVSSSSLNTADGKLTVFTFQPVEDVQQLNMNIRSKQYRAGNTAIYTFDDVIGSGAVIRETVKTAKLYARGDGTVLILGETGTGKELFAQSIHNYSGRRDGPFVAINCAALPESILESELFGYVKGAFTGAVSSGKAGYFEIANTGTIFLDEISEIPLEIQVKLLRVLQERVVRRIGDHKVFPLDVRVIAASNKNLSSMVEQGLFREDLYYRLAVLELYIPPLRERREDIAEIAQSVLRELYIRSGSVVRELSEDAKEVLEQNDWHGNVRHLQNILERAVLLSYGGAVTADALRHALSSGMHPSGAARTEKTPAVPLMEREEIERAMNAARGDRTAAAKSLGMSATTLWRRIRAIRETDAAFLRDLYFPKGS